MEALKTKKQPVGLISVSVSLFFLSLCPKMSAQSDVADGVPPLSLVLLEVSARLKWFYCSISINNVEM